MNIEMKNNKHSLDLINDECLKELKKIPNDSIDLIVTDPPIKSHQEEMPEIQAECYKRKSI